MTSLTSADWRKGADARRSFEAGVWSPADPGAPKVVMLRLAALIRDNVEQLALLESQTWASSSARLQPSTCLVLQESFRGEAIDKLYDEVAPAAPGNLAQVRREPLGLVGAVVPWNSPLDMAA